MKWPGMLVASLSAVNYGLWSHLRCSVQNANIFPLEILIRVAYEEKRKRCHTGLVLTNQL